jgi:hypothetical protein
MISSRQNHHEEAYTRRAIVFRTISGWVPPTTQEWARRQFFEAVQLNPRDPVATPIVTQMDELFAIDAEARRKTLTTAGGQIRG